MDCNMHLLHHYYVFDMIIQNISSVLYKNLEINISDYFQLVNDISYNN